MDERTNEWMDEWMDGWCVIVRHRTYEHSIIHRHPMKRNLHSCGAGGRAAQERHYYELLILRV